MGTNQQKHCTWNVSGESREKLGIFSNFHTILHQLFNITHLPPAAPLGVAATKPMKIYLWTHR